MNIKRKQHWTQHRGWAVPKWVYVTGFGTQPLRDFIKYLSYRFYCRFLEVTKISELLEWRWVRKHDLDSMSTDEVLDVMVRRPEIHRVVRLHRLDCKNLNFYKKVAGSTRYPA